MRRTNLGLILSTVVAGFLLGGGHASAATVCLTASDGSHNYGPQSSCSTTEAELAINLNDSHGASMTGSGVVAGSAAVVDFSSSTALDFSSGNATIKPPGSGTFSDLDITVPGYTFDDLMFHIQFTKTGQGQSVVENLTVTWGTGTGDSYTYPDNLKPNTDLTFFLVSPTPLTFVDLSTTTGFNEAKQFEISSVVPEPSTWAMMLVGFAGLGFAGHRKTRGARTAVSF